MIKCAKSESVAPLEATVYTDLPNTHTNEYTTTDYPYVTLTWKEYMFQIFVRVNFKVGM